jgi:hypothetical protein
VELTHSAIRDGIKGVFERHRISSDNERTVCNVIGLMPFSCHTGTVSRSITFRSSENGFKVLL